jgi:hypothetical protein
MKDNEIQLLAEDLAKNFNTITNPLNKKWMLKTGFLPTEIQRIATEHNIDHDTLWEMLAKIIR